MTEPVAVLKNVSLNVGARRLWSDLTLEIAQGEFLAVIGPNGSGKTSLLKALLGQLPIRSGNISVLGKRPGQANREIGYIPQQRVAETALGLRGKDFVAFGLDGTKWGPPIRSKTQQLQVLDALARVDAKGLADVALGEMSGGQQQRLRVAQALVGNPRLLLCDEPYLSLDFKRQQDITNAIERYRKHSGCSVVFVTHDVNPLLGIVDRVLYFTGERFALGTAKEVLQSKTLSEIFGTKIEVIRNADRVTVVGIPESQHGHHELAGRE
ncbi:MAG: ATP-binding cassette domain-containing protein [Cryobacterium sp.]|nr:ATP-binding cassette domain-containing protein [Cryobacterium sp.]